MKVKICGIKTLADALAASEAGADLLGFNFYPKSPRYIAPDDCKAILEQIPSPPFPVTVGVFVNASGSEISAILAATGLHLAQLSGDEPPETLTALKARAFKALRPPDAEALAAALARYPARPQAPAYLVDAYRPGEYGGTGQTADWGLARDLARRQAILLAGGLTPENVRAAIEQVNPWGVDVASGVESAPGVKDTPKMRAFVAATRRAIVIETASVADAAEILALQKLAYQSEAELNQDFTIPPLTQTLAEIQAQFERWTFLKAVADGKIIGSVRAELRDGTCHIGRLIVHPDCQNRGLGSRLLGEIEARFGAARRFELFTSELSAPNLYLYQKLGYKRFRTENLNQRLTLVYLEKNL
jgi:phosphoribosylanthranilate isomerase